MPLIVIEGIDGVGKTTLAQNIVARLRAGGVQRVSYLKFPDLSSNSGAQIAQMLSGKCSLNMNRLYELNVENRRAYADVLAAAAQSADDYIICDRYLYSGIAYSNIEDITWGFQREAHLPYPTVLIYMRGTQRLADRARLDMVERTAYHHVIDAKFANIFDTYRGILMLSLRRAETNIYTLWSDTRGNHRFAVVYNLEPPEVILDNIMNIVIG